MAGEHTIKFLEIQDQKLPDVQAEVDWRGGVNGLPSETKRLLLIGASKNLNGEIRRATSIEGAIDDYGEGSVMAGMVQAALTTSAKIELYTLSVDEGTGQATLDSTFTGNATAAGVIRIWAAGELFQVAVANGTAAASVATDVIAKIDNDKYNLPVGVSAGAAGVAQWDANELGLAGNSIRIRVDTTNVPGIQVNHGGGAAEIADDPLAAGATDVDPVTVLATLQGEQRYHLICLGSESTANITVLKTHMELMATPTYQRWGIGIVATVSGSATAQTIADTEDSKRLQLFSLPDSPRPVWEVAAAFAAARASKDARDELDDYELKYLQPEVDTTTWPSDPDLESDLDEGVTPAKFVRQGARVLITRSVHTEHSSGAAQQKAWDTTIVEKADFYREALILAFAKYKGATLKTASPAGRSGTLTPKKAVGVMLATAMRLDSLDYLQGVKTDNKNGLFVAQANATNPDRLDLGSPFRPSRSAHFIAIQVTYTF